MTRRLLAILCIGIFITASKEPLAQAAPEPDDAFRSEEVTIRNREAGLRLAGTLTMPVGVARAPAVVLITGSGPQDRDETVAGHKPFRVLAEHLARSGIATLRYDDRGVGRSSGSFADAAIPDFVSDARAAVRYLQERRAIDGGRIALLGHSEGGLVAPLVALEMPGEIAALVLLASPGVNGEQVFYAQDAAEARALGMDEATIERSRRRKELMFGILKRQPDRAKAAAELRTALGAIELSPDEAAEIAASGMPLEQIIGQQIRLLNNRATRVFLQYDPAPTLERTNVPTLALFGGRDLQVPPATHLHGVRAALERSPAGPRSVVRSLEGHNHLFQRDETGLPRNYGRIEETISPEALDTIAAWLSSALELSPRSSGSDASR